MRQFNKHGGRSFWKRPAAALLLLAALLPIRADVRQDGSFTLRIDIKLPVGTQNMAPKLALEYDSRNGDGMVGIGWRLAGIPKITRIAYTGPIQYLPTDTFADSEAGVLISQGGGVYFPKSENFTKFAAIGTCAGGPCEWVVKQADGITKYYGNTSDSAVQAVNSGGAIRVWALSRVEDRNGNAYTVTYINDATNGDFYPQTVTYTLGAGISQYHTVDFSYESRPDAFPSYAGGARDLISERLKWVHVRSNGSLVRKYRLDYQNAVNTGRSRLVAVQEYGNDGSSVLPAQAFTYQNGGSDFAADAAWGINSGGISGNISGISNRWSLADVNGDGFPDFVYQRDTDGHWMVKLNNGTSLGTDVDWGVHQFSIAGDAPGNNNRWRLIDVDADGKADLVYMGSENGQWFVKKSTGSGFQADAWFGTHQYSIAGDAAGVSNRWVLADLNGDMRPDFLYQRISDGHWIAKISNGTTLGADTDWGVHVYSINGDSSSFANRWRVLDVNGDQKADLVYMGTNGQWRALFSTGTGFQSDALWGTPQNGIAGDNASAGNRWSLSDVNGDGHPDLVFQSNADGRWIVKLNNGHSLEPDQDWGAHDYGIAEGRWRFADMNGDGKEDLVYQSNGSGQWVVKLSTGAAFGTDILWGAAQYGICGDVSNMPSPNRWVITDMTGDGKADFFYQSASNYQWIVKAGNGSIPDLLTAANNGQGGTTYVAYLPATQIASAVRPDINTGMDRANATTRPLVTATTVTDGRGGSFLRNYVYSDGRFLPGTLDAQVDLGFASFETVNYNTGESEKSFFFQDSVKYSHPSVVEKRAGNGSLVATSTYAYDSVSPNIGTKLVRETSQTQNTYNLGAFAFARTKSTTYDGYGNPTQVTESGAGLPDVTTSTTFNTDTVNWDLNKPTTISVTSGASTLKQTSFSYTGPNATQVCSWASGSSWGCTAFSFDANGNVASVTNPVGQTTTIAYDGMFRAQPATITNALGHVQGKTYNLDGQVAAETDPNGAVTAHSYDAFGRLLQTNLPNGGHTTYNVTALGDANNQFRSKITLTDGSRTTATAEYFDGLGFVYRTTTTGDSGSIEVLNDKDAGGRSYRTSMPFFSGGTPVWTTKTFDSAGRVSSATSPSGSVTTYAYGANTIATTSNGKTETRTINAAGKVISLLDAGGGTTSYSYDALGRATGVTLPDGSSLSTVFDGMNRKLSITEPNTGTSTFSYNAAGQLVSQTNARGQTIAYAYDAIGRVVLKDLPAGAGTDVTYQYDQPGFDNGIGRLTTKVDAGGTTEFSYNTSGQVQTRRMIVDGKSYSYTTSYDYVNRPTEVVYPDGSSVEYAYTNGGNLDTLKMNNTTYATWSSYDATGKPGNVALANGTSTAYAYDGTIGRITTLVTSAPAGQIQNLSYAFDGSSNVTGITDNRSNKIDGATGINTDETVTYAYDNMDRLTSASGVWGPLSYAYAANGNAANMEGRALSYTGQRATSGTNFSAAYDATGNMTSQTLDGVSWTYAYDAENRITQIHKGGTLTTSFVYDDNGQRVKKVYNRPDTSQVTTIYIGSGYEVRKRDGDEFHTINLHGNGQLVASVTQQGTIPTAMNLFQQKRALASLYNGKTVSGLFMKGGQYLAAVLVHPQTTKRLALGFSSAALALILLAFAWSLVRERMTGRGNGNRVLFSLPLRLVALSTAIVLSQASCGNAGMGSSLWIFGGNGLYHIPLKEALIGDTLNGMPLGTYFYHKNQVNSSTVITDATGTEATRITYKPFGTIDQAHSTGTDSVTRKFTGQVFDQESGLYYYNARYYNPAIGRFVTADTVVPGEGNDSQGFNRYAYVRNNPISYTDPSGNNWVHMLNEILKHAMGGVSWAAESMAATGGKIGEAIVGGMQWANHGLDGFIKWAGTGMGNGAKWAAKGVTGTVERMMRAADHSLRGMASHTDQGARRIGETFMEMLGRRHGNAQEQGSRMLRSGAAVALDIATFESNPYSWFSLGKDVGIFLHDARTLYRNDLSGFGVAGLAFALEATRPSDGNPSATQDEFVHWVLVIYAGVNLNSPYPTRPATLTPPIEFIWGP